MEYSLKKSSRAKRISISIDHIGQITLIVPKHASEARAMAFLQARQSWIEQTQAKLKNRFKDRIILDQSKKDFKINKSQALKFVTQKVHHFNTYYGFSIGKISVRNQKSRWGSCARNGNLNFNYGLIKVPEELADYVIVHEICHVKEFNHSKKFWDLVEQTIPDYKERRKKLKKNYISIT